MDWNCASIEEFKLLYLHFSMFHYRVVDDFIRDLRFSRNITRFFRSLFRFPMQRWEMPVF